MQFRLLSQLIHLDRSNDGLLKMYSCLYCDIPDNERGIIENISTLSDVRENLKLKLKCHLFRIKNNILPSTLCTILVEYLPIFLKLEKLAHRTYTNTRWQKCSVKEKQNIELYYQTLYKEDLPASTIEECLRHRKKLILI